MAGPVGDQSDALLACALHRVGLLTVVEFRLIGIRLEAVGQRQQRREIGQLRRRQPLRLQAQIERDRITDMDLTRVGVPLSAQGDVARRYPAAGAGFRGARAHVQIDRIAVHADGFRARDHAAGRTEQIGEGVVAEAIGARVHGDLAGEHRTRQAQ